MDRTMHSRRHLHNCIPDIKHWKQRRELGACEVEVVFESFEAGGSDLFNSVSRKCGMVMKAYNTSFLSISMREACAQGREMTTMSVCVLCKVDHQVQELPATLYWILSTWGVDCWANGQSGNLMTFGNRFLLFSNEESYPRTKDHET